VAQQQHLLTAAAPVPRTSRWLIAAAMVLTGLSMRTAVTSVGPVLGDLEAALGVGGSAGGLITTLPVVCFAAIGTAAPRLSHRFGEHLLLVAAMSLMTVGVFARALANSVGLFVLFSALALAGGAVSNVLMPSLVKRHFPDQIGRMTAVYTTAMSVGVTAAVALTVPLGDLGGGWRFGLGSWAALSVLAVLPWLPTLRGDRPDPDVTPNLPLRRLRRSPTAWALAVFFGAQSFQAYIAFGWFPTYLRDQGFSAAEAGWLVGFYAALSIPASMLMPTLAGRGQRRLILVLSACYLGAYVGLAVAPAGGAWVWMLLTGTGSGMFPLALTMFGLRTRTARTTGALSAFAQGIGYLLAGSGPLLVGVLLGSSHHWTGMFLLLFIALAVCVTAGLRAGRPVFVDDEIT
jgi:CP family cyanate transporter-like MFS transporter